MGEQRQRHLRESRVDMILSHGSGEWGWRGCEGKGESRGTRYSSQKGKIQKRWVAKMVELYRKSRPAPWAKEFWVEPEGS